MSLSIKVPPMLYHVSEYPSALRLSNVPLYIHIIFCLPTHPSMDSEAASIFWLLWMMLLWTCGTDISSCSRFQFFRVYTQESNCWIIYIFFKKSPFFFHNVYIILHYQQQCMKVPISLQPHQYLLYWFSDRSHLFL